MFNVKQFGQVFTPPHVVGRMLSLRRNFGAVLEPSAGGGAFFLRIPGCVGVEMDGAHCKSGMHNMDFFDYPAENKFATVIGNPPFVRWRDIPAQTRCKLPRALFDERSNLYLFFVEKCLRHLAEGGELIFITPRDFIKLTSAAKLNRRLFALGTVTHFFDLGDERVFGEYNPNCAIWRFVKGDFSRKTTDANGKEGRFLCADGQLIFSAAINGGGGENGNGVLCRDVFSVKVGAVSGMDSVFASERFGNADFVFSQTRKTGKTRRMIFNVPHQSLLPRKRELLARKIKRFGERDWWQWGRKHCVSDSPRVYVNAKTRAASPFFTHPCANYDGSVLALFPRDRSADPERLAKMLNATDWQSLGFTCGGRHIFSQRSLSAAPLPDKFSHFISP